jgi:hypothetical protein
MKIFELLNEETASEYEKRLIKTLKIPRLGSGAFSSVFQHPVYHNVVVKVVRRPDPKYMRYVEWCMRQGTTNPWVPWIIGVAPIELEKEHHPPFGDPVRTTDTHIRRLPRFQITGGKTYVVFMQKMKKASKRDIKAALDYIGSTMDPQDAKDIGIWNLSSFNVLDADDWKIIARSTNDPQLRAFAQRAARYNYDDIHSGNVMMRGKQLVFVDPVASI